MGNKNGITGGNATNSGKQIWHVFDRDVNRYVGSAFADRKGIFRCMEKMQSTGNLTALADADVKKGCFDEEGNEWTKNYRDLMGEILTIPAALVKSVTAEQSFRRWVKTRA